MAYIDKDLLLKDIGESVVFTIRNAETSPELRGARKIIDRIKNAPATDVVEVKHGEWISKTFKVTGRKFITCSVCNSPIDSTYTHIDENEFDYCPYCGAKMDKERKDT